MLKHISNKRSSFLLNFLVFYHFDLSLSFSISVFFFFCVVVRLLFQSKYA